MNAYPDRYTRVVLTVIAAALVWLCCRDLVLPREALAQSSLPKEVVIVGFKASDESYLPVKIVAIERGRWSSRVNTGPKEPPKVVTLSHPWDPLPVQQP